MTALGVQYHVKNRGLRLPGAGTLRRTILGRMLSTQGLTGPEAVKDGLVTARNGKGYNLHTAMNHFRDELFFDVRQVKRPGMKYTVYLIVGRWDSKGRYIDYLVGRIK